RKITIRLERSGALKRSFCTGEISRKNAQQTRLKIQPCALGQLSQSRMNHGNSLIQKTRVHAQIREIEIVALVFRILRDRFAKRICGLLLLPSLFVDLSKQIQ